MTTRTVQIYGKGYGPSDAVITVTLNGQTVFNGTVPTVNQPVPVGSQSDMTITEPIFSFDIPDTYGLPGDKIPMTCQVTNGTVIFAQIYVNFLYKRNPIFTNEEWAALSSPTLTRQQLCDILSTHATPVFDQTEINSILDSSVSYKDLETIFTTHNVNIGYELDMPSVIPSPSDLRTEVTIDGTQIIPDHTQLPGTYWWTISNGSTLSYNFNLPYVIKIDQSI